MMRPLRTGGGVIRFKLCHTSRRGRVTVSVSQYERSREFNSSRGIPRAIYCTGRPDETIQ